MKFLQVFLAGALLALSHIGGVNAADQNLVHQYRLAEALAYRTMSEFSVFSIDEGAARATKRLNEVLEQGNQQMSAVAGRWPAIAAEWNATRTFIDEHREAAVMHDVTMPPRLEAQMQRLYKVFETDRPDDSVLSAEQLVLHRALNSLEQMLAAYLYFNINVFGGHAVTETGIEAQSRIFESLLPKITDPELQQELSKKWLFVKTTLLAYNERSAVFIVDRTGQSMRALLLQALQQ